MPATKRANAAALAREEDSRLTKAEWMKMDAKSLNLKCNHYNLEEGGPKKEIVKRLYDELHKKPANDSDSSPHVSPDPSWD